MTKVLVVVAAAAMIAAACSSGDGDVLPVPQDDDATTTTAEATTTTEAEDEPVEDTTETAAVDLSEAEAAVIETWTTLLDAAASGAPTDEQLETIAALSDDDTTEQLQDFFPEAPAREITYHPALTEQDGTIAIDDCIIMNRGFSTGFSNWLLGQAEADPDSPTGYTITNIQLLNIEPCVPTSIADAAIEGYEQYWDAWQGFFNPPDPEAEAIEEHTTSNHRDLIEQLSTDFRDAGQVAVGRPSTEPAFLTLNSPTEVVIIDCMETDPEFGVYDESTGERTDFVPPVAEGQLDLRESIMLFEDGQWKVSDIQAATDVECRTPPLPETLQVTGG